MHMYSIKIKDQNLILIPVTRPERDIKLTVSLFLATLITVKQYVKLLVDTFISASVKKRVHFCRIKILTREERKRKWTS